MTLICLLASVGAADSAASDDAICALITRAANRPISPSIAGALTADANASNSAAVAAAPPPPTSAANTPTTPNAPPLPPRGSNDLDSPLTRDGPGGIANRIRRMGAMRRRSNLVSSASAAAGGSGAVPNPLQAASDPSQTKVLPIQPVPSLATMYTAAKKTKAEKPKNAEDANRVRAIAAFRQKFGDNPQPFVDAVVERIRKQVSLTTPSPLKELYRGGHTKAF